MLMSNKPGADMIKYADIPLSVCRGGATNPDSVEHTTVDSVFGLIRSDKLRQVTRFLRDCIANEDIKTYDEAKKHLPVILWSGTFKRRAKDAIIKYNGMVICDVDNREDAETIRDSLAGDPHILLCFLSPSGHGVKILIPTEAADKTDHLAAWYSCAAYLRTKGIELDKSGTDVSRACFACHDPGAWFNDSAVPLPVDRSLVPEPAKPRERASESGREELPGEWYSRTGDHALLLRKHGWTYARTQGDNEHWTRPGKTDVNTSATWNTDKRTFYNFSSSVTNLDSGKGYSLYQLYAIFEHNSDWKAASAALAKIRKANASPPPAEVDPEQFSEPDIETCPECHTDPQEDDKPAKKTGLIMQSMADTIERRPDWLWPGYLLRGCTHVLGGKQGGGKGLVIADLIARLTNGTAMPDGHMPDGPINVLVVTREDDPEMALKPRLRMAGADMNRVFWSHGDVHSDDPEEAARGMQEVAPYLEKAVLEHEIGYLVIDPIGAWFEEDSNSATEIRRIIDPMNQLGRRTKCAVKFVAHLRKNARPGEDPMDALAGSAQMSAAVRCAWLLTRLEGSVVRLDVVKTNFRQGASLHARMVRHPTATHQDDPPVIQWQPAEAESSTNTVGADEKETAVLMKLASRGNLSRRQLAKLLDWPEGTVRHVIDRMKNKGLVDDEGHITANGLAMVDDDVSHAGPHEGPDGGVGHSEKAQAQDEAHTRPTQEKHCMGHGPAKRPTPAGPHPSPPREGMAKAQARTGPEPDDINDALADAAQEDVFG